MRIIDTKDLPSDICAYGAKVEPREYAKGASPVEIWGKNYESSQFFALTPADETPLGSGMYVELIKQKDGNYVLSLRYGKGGVDIHDSLPVYNDVHNDIQNIVENITTVGINDKSGFPFVSMLGNGAKAIVINGYNTKLFPHAEDTKYTDYKAESKKK